MTDQASLAGRLDVPTVLAETAEQVLASEEFGTTIRSLGVSPNDLRDAVRIHARQLLSHPALNDPNDPRLREQRSERNWGYFVLWVGVSLLAVFASGPSVWSKLAWGLTAVVCMTLAGVVLLSRRNERPDILRSEVLEPFLREQITALSASYRYSEYLPVHLAPNLGELSRRSDFVSTSAADLVERMMASVASAHIGIAGPRGVGKTALLHRFCRPSLVGDDAHELRVFASAPVDYAARDFIIHLFVRLCEEVRARKAAHAWISRIAVLVITTLIHLAAICVIVLGLLMVANANTHWPVRDIVNLVRSETATHVMIGLAVAATGLALLTRFDRHRRVRPTSGVLAISLATKADEHLRRLRFLQSVTRGRSLSVNMIPKLVLGRSSSHQLTELPSTLPDLVEQYRAFATEVSIWWRRRNGGRGRMVVGIDELDKISDSAAAERFLNDLKAVFGVPHCFYLVSVSDEALEAFEQRGFLSKTVYDSAFDDVVRVSPLKLPEARQLIQRRVAGMPETFVALCHVLSSGLPRDLLRTARTLLELAGGRGDDSNTLGNLVKKFVDHDLQLIKQASLLSQARRNQQLPAIGPVDLLLDDTWPETLSKDVIVRLTERSIGTTEEMMRLASAAYFGATVVDVFVRPVGTLVVELQNEDRIFDELASIRNQMSLNAELAWERTSRFRAQRKMIVIPLPASPNEML
jgi:hypothetical protein